MPKITQAGGPTSVSDPNLPPHPKQDEPIEPQEPQAVSELPELPLGSDDLEDTDTSQEEVELPATEPEPKSEPRITMGKRRRSHGN